MWRHNEALKTFAEAAKIFRETANKTLNDITNRMIHFIKEGHISKLLGKNKYRSSLLNDCTDWHVATDLERSFRISNRTSINNPASKYCHLVR